MVLSAPVSAVSRRVAKVIKEHNEPDDSVPQPRTLLLKININVNQWGDTV
jgi:hypothetical protein